MITFVCEINPTYAKQNGLNRYYLAKAKNANWQKETNLHRSLLYGSDRVWRIYENGTVDFVKNRFTGIMTPADQRELTLALLSAVCYNKV